MCGVDKIWRDLMVWRDKETKSGWLPARSIILVHSRANAGGAKTARRQD